MKQIPLWHTEPCRFARGRSRSYSKTTISSDSIFPSGRQALSAILAGLGLRRADRVAIPEWSSHCVISAVGKVSTPIPLREVLENDIDVSCTVIYEHWGWSFSPKKLTSFLEAARAKPVIIDRVDTASLRPLESEIEGFELWSLSKLLGIKLGGLVRSPSRDWLPYSGEFNPSWRFNDLLYSANYDEWSPNASYFLKSYCSKPSDSVLELFKKLDLEAVIEAEGLERRTRAGFLSNELGDKDLVKRLANGGAPGIYPCALHFDRRKLLELQEGISKLGIESRVYNFNYSDDPAQPKYAECLALPVHSGMCIERMELMAEYLFTKMRS